MHSAAMVRRDKQGPRPRTQACPDGACLSRERKLPMLTGEFVVGRARKWLECPTLPGSERAQLAVNGLEEVAGDRDAARSAAP